MGSRIMVINDTQEILNLFHEILTDEGHEVTLYSYGMQDIKEIERVKPDLLILDYVVGREEVGWQLLQKVRMNRSTEGIPIIVCTTIVKMVQEIEGFLSSKRVQVVGKPFMIDDLLAAVSDALRVGDSSPT